MSRRQYRVQRRGHRRKRCREYQNWKEKYGSKETAQDAALSMAEDNPGESYYEFRCAHCNWWHVGRLHVGRLHEGLEYGEVDRGAGVALYYEQELGSVFPEKD